LLCSRLPVIKLKGRDLKVSESDLSHSHDAVIRVYGDAGNVIVI
jgi:hypothetical protein